jgi:CMP/dCMP kinase
MREGERVPTLPDGGPAGRPPDAAGGFSGVFALDGPSGTGKSTVARLLAIRLAVRYLDTGAMYRAATVAVLDRGIVLTDDVAITGAAGHARIEITTDPCDLRVSLDGVRVDERIRSAEVTAAVSAVSAVAAVRRQLVALQRQLIGAGSIVVEGRDIGTVVWPEARPKVYLTADAAVRARRRADQVGVDNVRSVASGLARRDQLDSSRSASPLVRAPDAVEVDTTELTIEQTLDRLVEMATRQSTGDAYEPKVEQ